MNIKDLMIGDLVKFHLEIFSTDYEGIETVHDDVLEIGKVSALNSIGNVWVTDSEGQEYQVIDDEIESIPLTTEILEKNEFGFIDTSNDEYLSEWTGWWILEGLELGCCDNLKFPVFFNIADTNVKVNYVHELQHALKLCGIKKEIIL